ncbi:unnamed protein product [Blepharisma stoltei]|uniref:Uncharacterized protein n=1 Tax=Blepharisma stoltei TaxID=1481888 RepID=A0AAU9K0X0_9CILI|nr:unnamed protein product [Blepharisma stoltei]
MQTPVRKISLSRDPTPKRRPSPSPVEVHSLLSDIRIQQHQAYELKDRISSLENRLNSSYVKSPKKYQPSQSENQSIQNAKPRFVTPQPRLIQPVKPEPISIDNQRLNLDLNNVCKSNITWLSNKEQIDFRKVLTERRNSVMENEEKSKINSVRAFTPLRQMNEKSIEDVESNISNLRISLQRQREWIYEDKENNSMSRRQMEQKYLALLHTVEDVTRQIEQLRYKNVILETEIKNIKGG